VGKTENSVSSAAGYDRIRYLKRLFTFSSDVSSRSLIFHFVFDLTLIFYLRFPCLNICFFDFPLRFVNKRIVVEISSMVIKFAYQIKNIRLKIRVVKKRHIKSSSSKKWFDKECRLKRHELRNLAKNTEIHLILPFGKDIIPS